VLFQGIIVTAFDGIDKIAPVARNVTFILGETV
jgi:hypothetical protein